MTGTYEGYNDRQEESVKLFYEETATCIALPGGETKAVNINPAYFTSDGESLFIKNEILYLGNRAYSRQ